MEPRRIASAAIVTLVVALSTSSSVSTQGRQNAPAGLPTEVSGVLSVVFADDFDNRRSDLHYTVRDDLTGREYRLEFERGAPKDLRPGARVRVRGNANQSTIFLAAADGSGVTVEGVNVSQSALTEGNRTIVIVVNFRDVAVPCSVQAIRDSMFTDPNGRSVAALYRECSVGRVNFTGDVVGPLTLDVASTDTCDVAAWTNVIESQAVAAGVDFSLYRHRVFVLPTSSCGAAGYGSVGGTPSRAWVFRCGIIGVFAHEVGHSLGMYHAATPGTEYDDATDPMTVGYNWLMGVNAPHRQQLGWHSAEGVKLVTESGTHMLAPLASDPSTVSAPQILMLKKADTNEYYYLSYRLPIGFDRNIDGSFHQRVSVHQYKGDGSGTKTYRLAGLTDGASFTDPVNGITVTMTSHDSAGATVSVMLPAPAVEPVPPAVSATPASQTGEPGSVRSYTLAVTNRNAASSPAANFDLTSAVPAGWTASLSAQRLTLASGETGHAQLTLSSPQTATPGEYHSSVQVRDAAQAAQPASTEVTLILAAETDTTPPSAPANVQGSFSQKLKQVVVSWTSSADNVQVSGYRVWRDGTMVALSASTKWADPSTSSGVTYTYVVEAYDVAGNVSPPSSSVVVTPGGRRK
jgi:hypothetical protein